MEDTDIKLVRFCKMADYGKIFGSANQSPTLRLSSPTDLENIEGLHGDKNELKIVKTGCINGRPIVAKRWDGNPSLISCWSILSKIDIHNLAREDSLWKWFQADFAIVSSVKKIENLIKLSLLQFGEKTQFRHGPVTYYNQRSNNFHEVARSFKKENYFEVEKEYRFVIQLSDHLESTNLIINNPASYIDEIYYREGNKIILLNRSAFIKLKKLSVNPETV